jgi:hypothetical protein
MNKNIKFPLGINCPLNNLLFTKCIGFVYLVTINICDGRERCRAVAEEMGDGRTQIMKFFLKKCEILMILKTMFRSPGGD